MQTITMIQVAVAIVILAALHIRQSKPEPFACTIGTDGKMKC